MYGSDLGSGDLGGQVAETNFKYGAMSHNLEVKVDRGSDVTVYTGAEFPFLNEKPVIRKIADLKAGDNM